MTILEQMKNIQANLATMKPDFQKYIQDKTVSLEERWNVFVNTPAEMKNNKNYNPEFNSLPADFIMYEGPIHMERGETKTGVELVENIEESIQDIKDDIYFGKAYNQKELDKVDLDKLKEEILKMNLGKFRYDW